MLAVRNAPAAIEFYKAAFGATVEWVLADAVAGLVIDGAPFFLAQQSPDHGNRAPDGFTTVRIELFVDDPVAVQRRAIAAGGTERTPVQEHDYTTTGPRPIARMLQGSIKDPDGHTWLVGKFLD